MTEDPGTHYLKDNVRLVLTDGTYIQITRIEGPQALLLEAVPTTAQKVSIRETVLAVLADGVPHKLVDLGLEIWPKDVHQYRIDAVAGELMEMSQEGLIQNVGGQCVAPPESLWRIVVKEDPQEKRAKIASSLREKAGELENVRRGEAHDTSIYPECCCWCYEGTSPLHKDSCAVPLMRAAADALEETS